MNPNNKKGFTLIRILTVIAIIGVLAAILIPATDKAMESASKSKEVSKLRQIVLANASYSNPIAEAYFRNEPTVHKWLATLDQEIPVLTPQLFILSHDQAVRNNSIQTLQSFQEFKFYQSPISLVVVNKLSTNPFELTNPVAWIQSLLRSEKCLILTEKKLGGDKKRDCCIAFGDGNVNWYRDLVENKGWLTHYISRTPIGSIMEAISSEGSNPRNRPHSVQAYS